MSQQLAHFIQLANRGRSPAASGGEQRAWAIAQVLLEHTPGLDADATAGIGELANLVGEKSWLDWDDITSEVLPQSPSSQANIASTQSDQQRDEPSR